MRHHEHSRHAHRPDASPRRGQRHDHGEQRRFARDPLDAGERHGPHRHGGRRRLFDYGDLRFILLQMIADKPSHGYDLIKTLEERMGGGYSPSPGVIYPTLTMLEEQGFADVAAEGGKKQYRATAEGQAYLLANQATVDAIQSRIDALAKERTAQPPAPILRAVENLKTALRLRLGAGPIPADRIAAIAAAIDAAAVAAEKAVGPDGDIAARSHGKRGGSEMG
jgi:DNA-binding PadR family transcriptional regulator